MIFGSCFFGGSHFCVGFLSVSMHSCIISLMATADRFFFLNLTIIIDVLMVVSHIWVKGRLVFLEMFEGTLWTNGNFMWGQTIKFQRKISVTLCCEKFIEFDENGMRS